MADQIIQEVRDIESNNILIWEKIPADSTGCFRLQNAHDLRIKAGIDRFQCYLVERETENGKAGDVLNKQILGY